MEPDQTAQIYTVCQRGFKNISTADESRRILLWPFTGLPVGFFWLRYSVLCTVEPLSLLYLLFISMFLEMMH